MPPLPYLSLVLACYNEEEILAESFRTIRETLDELGRPWEIVFVDDVSLEVHPRYIPSLVRAIEKGADVAVVRRIYAFQLRSLDRYFMSRGYSYLVRKLLGTPLHDTETG